MNLAYFTRTGKVESRVTDWASAPLPTRAGERVPIRP